jgi:hypothetical protein
MPKLPNENTMPRIILEYMSKDVWISVSQLYELMWLIGSMPNEDCFSQSFSKLNREGWFHSRRVHTEYSERHYAMANQYRIKDEYASIIPQRKRGRIIRSGKDLKCNWFKRCVKAA